MQNNTSDRREIHTYPVTHLCKACKNQRDYYMGQKSARSLISRATILGATAGNEIFYYSPLLQTRARST